MVVVLMVTMRCAKDFLYKWLNINFFITLRANSKLSSMGFHAMPDGRIGMPWSWHINAVR